MADNETHPSDLEIKIFRTLMLEGADLSSYELAKKLGVSPTTLDYKLRKMFDEGKILGYKYRINPFKIGFSNMAWCFVTGSKNVDLDKVEDFLFSIDNVVSTQQISGEYDILLKIYYRNPLELNRFILSVEKSLRGQIEDIQVISVTRPYKIHQVQMLEKDLQEAKLDEKDLLILNYVSQKPSAKIKEISKSLNLHRNTVSSRLNRLLDEKIILKKSIRISREYMAKMGMCFRTVMFVDCDAGKTEEVAKELQKFEEIHELTALSAHGDFLCVVRTRNIEDCFSLVTKVRHIPHVQRTRSIMVFKKGEEHLVSPLLTKLKRIK